MSLEGQGLPNNSMQRAVLPAAPDAEHYDPQPHPH